MTEVIILRHAETEADNLLKGSLDTDITHLSDYGLLTTIVTARKIREYYMNVPVFYFAHGHYKRAAETAEIVETVVPTDSAVGTSFPIDPIVRTDEYHLPPDRIYRQELLGAKPLEIKHLRERNFGSLEGKDLSVLVEKIKNHTHYPDLTDFLLYGSSEEFAELARRLGVTNPEWGEGFRDVFERAYRVSNGLLRIIKTIDSQREKSVIVLTSHRIFGNYLINALINSISAYHFPDVFEGDKKYSKHLLHDYTLDPSRFARFEITIRNDKDGQRKPHIIIKEVNDGKHLVCIEYMPVSKRQELIEEARTILEGGSKKATK